MQDRIDRQLGRFAGDLVTPEGAGTVAQASRSPVRYAAEGEGAQVATPRLRFDRPEVTLDGLVIDVTRQARAMAVQAVDANDAEAEIPAVFVRASEEAGGENVTDDEGRAKGLDVCRDTAVKSGSSLSASLGGTGGNAKASHGEMHRRPYAVA